MVGALATKHETKICTDAHTLRVFCEESSLKIKTILMIVMTMQNVPRANRVYSEIYCDRLRFLKQIKGYATVRSRASITMLAMP